MQRAAGAVHLDSLFIDEGFGTLDPDTLALVSDTIQSLRVGGRMVGIITHIPELRDEFAQQIIVTKHQGFSTVEVRGLVAAASFMPGRTPPASNSNRRAACLCSTATRRPGGSSSDPSPARSQSSPSPHLRSAATTKRPGQ